MEPSPDGSFVRAVPGEYARREVAGLLLPARGFVVASDGTAVPVTQAHALDAPPLSAPLTGPDPSRVQSVPAAPMAYAFETTTGPTGRPGQRLRPSVFSSDPNAAPAPVVDLSPPVEHALNWIKADMENVPYGRRVFDYDLPRQGGTPEVRAGHGGAPIYQAIIGDVSGASRADVLKAIENLQAGKRTPVGDLVLDVAQDLADGKRSVVRLMSLPPDAGGDVTGTRWDRGAVDDGYAAFASAVDDAATGADATAVREPGEEGAISPVLAARLGLGGAGAAYGAATGTDTADRVKRAALFGVAGALAPSLLRSEAMALPSPAAPHETAPASRGPVPRADTIPPDQLRTMPVLTDDVQQAADDLLRQYGGFQGQRRGVQSVARTEALSDRVGVLTDQPLAAGTALNAERLRAYQNATATLLQRQQALERSIAQGTPTPAQLLELEKTRTEARVLTQSFRGAASEAGRALHILRYQARILASADPEAIREATQITQRGLAADAQSFYYANILSGIGTHERNVLGNLTNVVYNLAAHPFTVAADGVRSASTGQARTVFLGELPERVAGTVAALPRAFSNALHVLRTGIPPVDVSSFDRPVTPEFLGGGANPFNYPSRALNAVDDLFATVAGQQSLYAEAFAKAKAEGHSGPALLTTVAHYKANPTPEMLQAVEGQRARLLFREEPGALAEAVLAAKRRLPALGYVVPFVRVPANIIRQGFEASPAGFAMAGARAGGRAGADAMGRAALGTVALAPLAFWAAAGKITGDAPSDPAKRAAFYESGKRPNSILLGDTWVNYQTIQPLNVPLAVVANGFQTWADAKHDPDSTADQIAKDVILRTGGSLLDQSFLSGLSALVDALGDPERYGTRFMQQLATGFVPFSGALRTVAQATDPTVRAPQSMTQGVQAIIPGQSQKLEPRLTRFGEPVARGADPLNVFKPSPVVVDPVASEMDAQDVRIRPAQGRKTVTVARGREVALTPAERTALGQASGRAVRQQLEAVIASPSYQQASPAQQQAALDKAISSARASVNERVRLELLRRMQGGR